MKVIWEVVYVISVAIFVAALIRFKKKKNQQTTVKAAEAAVIDTWAIFNLLLDLPSNW